MLDRLKKEIRDIVKSPEDLIMEKVGELKWMNACIEEGLRIFPPIPIGLLRTVPKRGSDIDGHFVPAGVSQPLQMP
jgi:cytochrome P450